MKQFNLEEALSGKPVRLRAGHKAFVLCNVNDYFKNNTKSACLAGIRSCLCNDDYYSMLHWDLSGNIHGNDTISDYDIIEMWEEPELSSDEVLEKAYKENLRVTFPKALLTNGYEVIARTKHGSYIISDGRYMVDSAVTGETYSLLSDQESTIDLEDLPKPFTPEETQPYYYINGGYIECENDYTYRNIFDKKASKYGNCFRTREDVEKWLNFMSRFKE